jgi:hypothetical protein
VESSAAGRRLPWATMCASQERDAWLRGLDSTLFLIRHVHSQAGAANAAWLWRSFPLVRSLRSWTAALIGWRAALHALSRQLQSRWCAELRRVLRMSAGYGRWITLLPGEREMPTDCGPETARRRFPLSRSISRLEAPGGDRIGVEMPSDRWAGTRKPAPCSSVLLRSLQRCLGSWGFGAWRGSQSRQEGRLSTPARDYRPPAGS